MITVHRDAEGQVEDAVVAAQVIGPEEVFLAQFDARREEAEHGVEDGHLHEHGQVHGCALFLQRIAVLVFRIDHFDLGLQDAHLGARDQVLVGQRHQKELDDHGEHQDDDAVVPSPAIEPVEDRDHQPAVHPAEDAPTQIDDLLELGDFGPAQCAIMVRAEVEAHWHGELRTAFLFEVQLGRIVLGMGAIGERGDGDIRPIAGEA